MPNQELSSPAGGSATALGMAFQHRVGAWLAVRILAETNASPLWGWPNSSTIEFIRCETEQPVDDIMVGSSDDGLAFIQVKRSISLERNSDSPFAKTVAQFVRQALRPPVLNNRPVRPWDRILDFRRDRLVLAVGPDTSGKVTSTLAGVLTKIRSLHEGTSVEEAALSLAEKETLSITCDHIRAAWQTHSGTAPSDDDIRKLLSITYVEVLDVEPGCREEREATDTVRSTILLRPDEAQAAWTTLIDDGVCGRVDQLSPEPRSAVSRAVRRLLLRLLSPTLLSPSLLRARLVRIRWLLASYNRSSTLSNPSSQKRLLA
jgi:hypothetical protein